MSAEQVQKLMLDLATTARGYLSRLQIGPDLRVELDDFINASLKCACDIHHGRSYQANPICEQWLALAAKIQQASGFTGDIFELPRLTTPTSNSQLATGQAIESTDDVCDNGSSAPTAQDGGCNAGEERLSASCRAGREVRQSRRNVIVEKCNGG